MSGNICPYILSYLQLIFTQLFQINGYILTEDGALDVDEFEEGFYIF